ncbi:hypothetical protein K491DRAFT_588799 [Lophiostoma macrostomum CBS 122681]|uniref:Uncharacterized protein n=1 Tax=Lophiostoma macrostomum CBS 122681 TaxID=1314788 RepID=A0A6A6TLE4_9PLEO|nr:hypothetical protein K491DRAFT_588799 [Lophiostoma macrostomum CBS 122681]
MDATGNRTRPASPFLRLPPHIRKKIYVYLLPIHPGESVTTINYDLAWPFLQHPSSTTFTPHQLDLCKCPQQAQEHIYTRYLCHAPKVCIHPKSAPYWILEEPGPAFNILRPASEAEEMQRPDAGVIRLNRMLYEETLPLLYSGRNFLLLTGICSRGRYQAHATLIWLSTISPTARAHITSISLLVQSNEEDCRDEDAPEAYRKLAKYVVQNLGNCKHVCVNVWPSLIELGAFSELFRREDMCVILKEHHGQKRTHEFRDRKAFMRFLAK